MGIGSFDTATVIFVKSSTSGRGQKSDSCRCSAVDFVNWHQVHNRADGLMKKSCKQISCLVWIVGLSTWFACTGCVDSVADKALPAALRDEFGYSIEGYVPRINGGDHFEVGESKELHYVRIRGIRCPVSGQKYFSKARTATRKITKGKKRIRVEVVDRDESMIEIADVFVINDDPADIVGDRNVGLELLRQGLAWFDGSEFENANQYRKAETEAKENELGLWSQTDPEPPWEFDARRQRHAMEELRN